MTQLHISIHDEYVGLGPDHPASFRRFLHERFVDELPVPPAAFHELDGLAEPEGECRRLAALVPQGDFDVALIGIGENGHLAFNDPPADFETLVPYRVVALDEHCRQQQVGEGWFPTLADVPTRAMGIDRVIAVTDATAAQRICASTSPIPPPWSRRFSINMRISSCSA